VRPRTPSTLRRRNSRRSSARSPAAGAGAISAAPSLSASSTTAALVSAHRSRTTHRPCSSSGSASSRGDRSAPSPNAGCASTGYVCGGQGLRRAGRRLARPDMRRGARGLRPGSRRGLAPSQAPPAKGTGPRVAHRRAAWEARHLPDALLGWVGTDERPMIVPVGIGPAAREGIALLAPPGLLPAGARRAGLTAHWFSRGVTGQRQIVHAGWLDGRTYAPHTRASYFMAPLRPVYRLVVGAQRAGATAAAFAPGKRSRSRRPPVLVRRPSTASCPDRGSGGNSRSSLAIRPPSGLGAKIPRTTRSRNPSQTSLRMRPVGAKAESPRVGGGSPCPSRLSIEASTGLSVRAARFLRRPPGVPARPARTAPSGPSGCEPVWYPRS
jgi:hypothetical protein